jgi:hypothetical protein
MSWRGHHGGKSLCPLHASGVCEQLPLRGLQIAPSLLLRSYRVTCLPISKSERSFRFASLLTLAQPAKEEVSSVEEVAASKTKTRVRSLSLRRRQTAQLR